MSKQNQLINEELPDRNGGNNREGSQDKKAFVEPTISVPVDVLEATSFFQPGTSGVTN